MKLVYKSRRLKDFSQSLTNQHMYLRIGKMFTDPANQGNAEEEVSEKGSLDDEDVF